MKNMVMDRKKPPRKKDNTAPVRDPGLDMGLVDKVLEGFDTTAKDIILPVLRRTQEVFGYIPEDVVFELSKRLKLPPADLYGVATFYDQFMMKPQGRHIIRLCTNVACNILGAEDLLGSLSRKLGVGKGATTADGRFTLLDVECIGACGKGPAMMVDDDFHYNLADEKVDKILTRYL
jgi:NADH-quinone oxidoreductase E subunit